MTNTSTHSRNSGKSLQVQIDHTMQYGILCADIHDMLTRLADAADEHFGAGPDEVNGGHVGNAAFIAAELREISDRVFHEGEYA